MNWNKINSENNQSNSNFLISLASHRNSIGRISSDLNSFLFAISCLLFFVLFLMRECRCIIFLPDNVTGYPGVINFLNDGIGDHECTAFSLIVIRVNKDKLSFGFLLLLFRFFILVSDHFGQPYNNTVSSITLFRPQILSTVFIRSILVSFHRVVIFLFTLFPLAKWAKLFFINLWLY